MGHLVGKDLYRKLGRKIDGLTMRAPWNEQLYAILKELYSPEEAEIAVKMPYGLCDLDNLQRSTGMERARLHTLIDGMCAKGIVADFWHDNRYYYVLSPLVIGIFEFTMMRTQGSLNTKEWARLFHEYLHEGSFYAANCDDRMRVGPLRALPYEETIDNSEHVEILDYEKASAIIDRAQQFAIGMCSCRHEKLHAGVKKCTVPLETCSTMGPSTEYMVRHGFARAVSRTEMLDNLARCRELGLVMCADNVKQDVSFICFCCGCCCNVLLGISQFGYPHAVVTSTFVAETDADICSQCGTCVEACPIHAITSDGEGAPAIDQSICLGCGVCGLTCQTQALRLVKREQRVLHPETTFERVILQSLERGTLQNLIFADPECVTHKFMRAFVGGFLRLPPVKQALMSEKLRSSFLESVKKGAGVS